MSNLQDKVVLITGSSQGIGRQMALEAAKKGAKIVLNARKMERLEQTKSLLESQGVQVLAVAGDVTIPEDCARLVEAAVQHFGRLDVLVNNAGIGTQFPLEEIQPHVLRQIVDINLNGSMYCAYYALPHLKNSRGSILFIGSIAGIHGIPHSNVYSATKMALIALAESLRLETHHYGIHIGLAYVGFTQNDPEKQFVRPDGSLMTRPDRKQGMVEPVDKVASGLIQMIEKRQHKRVFSTLGHTLYWLNRLSPNLVSWFLKKNLHKFKIS
jgi:short-subunit dehydrogenase